MLVNREWQDVPELFEAVSDQLLWNNDGEEFDGSAHNEEGPYGEQGFIIVIHNGRRFYLKVVEEII